MDKTWYKSKGVWGGIVGMLGGVATLAGVQLDAPLQTELVDIAVGVGELAGGALAIYGRIKAIGSIVIGMWKKAP